MRSSSEQYFERLDHVRGVAAFLVFSWHFIHAGGVSPDYVPSFVPFSLLEEGHVGVGLFMVLSGYLFAKIIGDRRISYSSFYWNRFLRLAPLLTVVLSLTFLMQWLGGTRLADIGSTAVRGFILPEWPNGAWSVAVEMHFYLIMPLLILCAVKRPFVLITLTIVPITLRTLFYLDEADIRNIASYTIIGRADQFIFGMAAAVLFRDSRPRHSSFWLAALVGMLLLYGFNLMGGYYGTMGSPIWIIEPTVEGAAFALVIALYDRSRIVLPRRMSRALAATGLASFSIYLWHLLFARQLATLIDAHLIDMSNFLSAALISSLAFVAFVPIGLVSYRTIELPFLQYRRRYIREDLSAPHLRTAVAKAA